MTAIFAITTTICAVGWIKNKISSLALSAFLVNKNIRPTDEELNECVRFVIKKLLKAN